MKVCFIGGGNMASAMIGGLLKSGLAADWQDSSVKLYEAAAEIARKLGQ